MCGCREQGVYICLRSPVFAARAIYNPIRVADCEFHGELTFRRSYSQTSTDTPALDGVSRLASSSDGRQLYAASPATGKVTAFGLGINGELTRIGSSATDEPGTLSSASALLAGPGLDAVMAAGSLHVFKRLSRGNVAALEVLIAGRDANIGLRAPAHWSRCRRSRSWCTSQRSRTTA